MPDLTRLTTTPESELPSVPELLTGKVATTATSESDEVYVVREGLRHGPCHWSPLTNASGVYWPHRGDPCTIAYPDEGTGQPEIVNFRLAALRAPDDTISVADGSDKNYTHSQTSGSAVWTINHMLGKIPSITYIDGSGNQLHPTEHHPSANQTIATFSPDIVSGEASCN